MLAHGVTLSTTASTSTTCILSRLIYQANNYYPTSFLHLPTQNNLPQHQQYIQFQLLQQFVSVFNHFQQSCTVYKKKCILRKDILHHIFCCLANITSISCNSVTMFIASIIASLVHVDVFSVANHFYLLFYIIFVEFNNLIHCIYISECLLNCLCLLLFFLIYTFWYHRFYLMTISRVSKAAITAAQDVSCGGIDGDIVYNYVSYQVLFYYC